VSKKRIEHVTARLGTQGHAGLVQMSIMGKLFSEAEGAGRNLRFDAAEGTVG
jgi:hypothetical protein